MPALIDLTGKKFGMLTVISRGNDRISPSTSKRTMWTCKCECGNTKDVSSVALTRGRTKSCGCSTWKFVSDKNTKNIVGMRFGKLVVIEQAESKLRSNGRHRAMWKCVCDCGREKVCSGDVLLRGESQSCGCARHDGVNTKSREYKDRRGLSTTRLYSIYRCMINRCDNENTQSYNNYGGRGITVCDEWKNDFLEFYKWANDNGYEGSLTLDRVDNNIGYSPENCRWVDRLTQANNTRNNTLAEFDGDTKTIAQWAREKNVPYNKLLKYYHSNHEKFIQELSSTVC